MLRALLDKGDAQTPPAAETSDGGAAPNAEEHQQAEDDAVETAKDADGKGPEVEENHEGEEEQAVEEFEDDPNMDVD